MSNIIIQFITNYDIFWQPANQATLIPFLDSFEARYGIQSVAVCADSGYDSEMNYEYLVDNNPPLCEVQYVS